MKTIILTLLTITSVATLSAQDLVVSTVSSAGGCLKSASYRLDFAVGQTFSHTLASDDFIIREGVLQTFDDLTSSDEEIYAPLPLSIFPNPSSDYVVVDQTNRNEGVLSIYNSAGWLMKSMRYSSGNTVSIQDLYPGQYIIEFVVGKEKMISQFIKQ